MFVFALKSILGNFGQKFFFFLQKIFSRQKTQKIFGHEICVLETLMTYRGKTVGWITFNGGVPRHFTQSCVKWSYVTQSTGQDRPRSNTRTRRISTFFKICPKSPNNVLFVIHLLLDVQNKVFVAILALNYMLFVGAANCFVQIYCFKRTRQLWVTVNKQPMCKTTRSKETMHYDRIYYRFLWLESIKGQY